MEISEPAMELHCYTADPMFQDQSSTDHCETKNRFRTIKNIFVSICVLASIVLPIVLVAPVSGNIKELYKPCDYSGNFDIDAIHRNPSDPSNDLDFSAQFYYYYKSFRNLFSRPSIVTVTIAFGNYTFSQAKWLDLAWDIGVGRIGQIALAYVSYSVITRSMLSTMERTAIPHRLFMDISFLGPSSMMTLWRVITVAPKSHLWKAWKGRLVVLAFNMVYLIAFPTLLSAMTGYVTTFSTRINFGNTTINYDHEAILRVSFTIGNCSIFQWDGLCHVTKVGEGYGIFETGQHYDTTSSDSIDSAFSCQGEDTGSTSTSCETFKVQERHLNIKHDSLNINKINDTYAYDGTLYNEDYISENGFCQPGKEYHWGFSYQLLFIFAVLNLFWTVSLWILWLRARGEYGVRTNYGMYRAALDWVAVVKGMLGEDVEAMSNAEIEKELEERRVGIVGLKEYSLKLDEISLKLVQGWDWTEPYREKRKLSFKERMDKSKRFVEEFRQYLVDFNDLGNHRLN